MKGGEVIVLDNVKRNVLETEVGSGCGRNLYFAHASFSFIVEGIVVERRACILWKGS
jgi:hypothetical protein